MYQIYMYQLSIKSLQKSRCGNTVIQEFAIEAIRHQLGISSDRVEGFRGLFRAQHFSLHCL